MVNHILIQICNNILQQQVQLILLDDFSPINELINKLLDFAAKMDDTNFSKAAGELPMPCHVFHFEKVI